jgi:hypothetical protein
VFFQSFTYLVPSLLWLLLAIGSPWRNRNQIQLKGQRRSLTERSEIAEKRLFVIAGDPASVGTFGDGGNKKQARRCRAPMAEGLRCYEKSASHRFFIKISPFSAISVCSSEAGERKKTFLSILI